MLKKLLLSLATVVVATLTVVAPTAAEDRVQWLYGIQPPSNWMNKSEKNGYVSLGQLVYDMLGRNQASLVSNLGVTAASGLYVQAGPAVTNTYASLYQVGATDINNFGLGGPFTGTSSAFSPDPEIIFHQGLLASNTSPIGPVVVPTTAGTSVIDVVECQTQIVDINQQSVNFVSATNVASAGNAYRDRADVIACQMKLGVAGTTPAVPATDSGWVSVAQITVPYGASSVNNTMINVLPQFGGFQQSGSGAQYVDTTTNGQTIAATKTWSGVQTLNSGAQYNGSSASATSFAAVPGTSSDGQTHRGLLINVGDSSSGGAQYLTNGALNGAVITPGGAFKTAATTSLAAAVLTVAGGTWDGTTLASTGTTALALKSGAVEIGLHKSDGQTNPYTRNYDGGSTVYSQLSATGLAFQQNSTQYSYNGAVVNGNIASSVLTPGYCLTADSSHNIISTAGACGLSSGNISSLTGGSNITATVTSGAATVAVVASPVFAAATVGGSTTTGALLFGTDGNYNIARSGGAFTINPLNSSANPTLTVAGGFLAGNMTLNATSLVMPGNVYGNYNSGSSSNGVLSYDGGTTVHSSMLSTGLTFTQNSTAYNYNSALVNGIITSTVAANSGTIDFGGTNHVFRNDNSGFWKFSNNGNTANALTIADSDGSVLLNGGTFATGGATFSPTQVVVGSAGFKTQSGSSTFVAATDGTNTLLRSSGINYFQNAAGSVNLATLDQSGNFTAGTSVNVGSTYMNATTLHANGTASITGAATIGGTATVGSLAAGSGAISSAGDVACGRSGGTTCAYFFGSTGSKYLYYDGTNFNLTGGGLYGAAANFTSIASTGGITAAGAISTSSSLGFNGGFWTTNGSSVYMAACGSCTGGGYIANAGNTAALLSWDNVGNWSTAGTSTSTQFYGTGSDGFKLSNGTLLGSNAGQTVAGVGASAFKVFTGSNLVALDTSGNLGIQGAYYAASERRLKNNIQDLPKSRATYLAQHTQIVRFCYKTEKCKPGEHRHIGFIADDTDTDLATNHKAMDIEAVAAVALQASSENAARIEKLENQVALLSHQTLRHRNLLEKLHDAFFGD